MKFNKNQFFAFATAGIASFAVYAGIDKMLPRKKGTYPTTGRLAVLVVAAIGIALGEAAIERKFGVIEA